MAKSSSRKKRTRRKSEEKENKMEKEKDEEKEKDDELFEEPYEEENLEVEERRVLPEDLEHWQPKTELGRLVKEGKIRDIDEILDEGRVILEPEIVDALLPNLSVELILIGQAKGKFGGGQRRVFRQTQKKTEEGNKPHFSTLAVVGDGDGHIGIGVGKGKETVPAREKAIRKAKLNIMKIRRGCGSWVCHCGEPHSVPFRVTGRCASVEIDLIPAPKGKGLVIEKELAKILRLAGIKDVWSKVRGQTRNKLNLVNALLDAFKKMSQIRVHEDDAHSLGLIEGSVKV